MESGRGSIKVLGKWWRSNVKWIKERQEKELEKDKKNKRNRQEEMMMVLMIKKNA